MKKSVKPPIKTSSAGWRFENSYALLPAGFYTKLKPEAVSNPKIVIVNHSLAQTLGLDLESSSQEYLANIFSGNEIPDDADPLAQAYAGHQYGHFTTLGDGRAHLLGEHITPDGQRFDIQLKGSGRTAYARSGDGRAALGPMLREYIISEAIQALGIPTTRSLSVVTTGEPVFREKILQGAILARVASSHIRIGTFEYFAAKRDREGLKILADYTIERHYPSIKNSKTKYLDLLKSVMQKHIVLVNEWLRVGFIHGVMNTDNVAISGETIDYGPCAFMDSYDPNTVFSSIDRRGRYAYANQPHITQWNLAKFAEAILPLIHKDIEVAAKVADEVIQSYNSLFQDEWLNMMRRKLGLLNEEKKDLELIGGLLKWMQRNAVDYTNTFHDLSSQKLPKAGVYNNDEFQNWYKLWQERLARNNQPLEISLALMQKNNPAIIPRNHKVEEALNAAEQKSDFSYLHKILDALSEPYKEKNEYKEFAKPPKQEERVLQTFCGT